MSTIADLTEEKRFVRRVALWSAVAAAVLVAAVLLLRAYGPQLRAARVSRLIDAGRAEEALVLMDELTEDDVGPGGLEALQYRAAVALGAQGREEEALALFISLSDYSDAAERASGLRLNAAIRLEEAGKLAEAAEAYYLLGNYGDAEARYERCVSLLYPEETSPAEPTPSPDGAPAGTGASRFAPKGGTVSGAGRKVLGPLGAGTKRSLPAQIASASPGGLSAAAAPAATETEAERLSRLRAACPNGRLALGGFHTVMARADGTVLATGRDDCGQCQVAPWRDVKAVAAGRAHTLALLDNGTVLAAGDNAYGQCDVAQWQNVVQIAANDHDSFALLADGTVAHTGYHTYPELAAWHGIRKLAAGSYGVIGLYAGGVLASHPSMKLGGVLWDATVARGYSVGLKEDGTVVSDALTLPEWTGIVSLSAGENAVLALDAEGNVHSYFFRAADALAPASIDGRVSGVVAGAAHYALTLEDGRVLCFGENEYGQCDTEGWDLGR